MLSNAGSTSETWDDAAGDPRRNEEPRGQSADALRGGPGGSAVGSCTGCPTRCPRPTWWSPTPRSWPWRSNIDPERDGGADRGGQGRRRARRSGSAAWPWRTAFRSWSRSPWPRRSINEVDVNHPIPARQVRRRGRSAGLRLSTQGQEGPRRGARRPPALAAWQPLRFSGKGPTHKFFRRQPGFWHFLEA